MDTGSAERVAKPLLAAQPDRAAGRSAPSASAVLCPGRAHASRRRPAGPPGTMAVARRRPWRDRGSPAPISKDRRPAARALEGLSDPEDPADRGLHFCLDLALR